MMAETIHVIAVTKMLQKCSRHPDYFGLLWFESPHPFGNSSLAPYLPLQSLVFDIPPPPTLAPQNFL